MCSFSGPSLRKASQTSKSAMASGLRSSRERISSMAEVSILKANKAFNADIAGEYKIFWLEEKPAACVS